MDRYLDKFNYEKDYRNKTRPEEFTDQKNIDDIINNIMITVKDSIKDPNKQLNIDSTFMANFNKIAATIYKHEGEHSDLHVINGIVSNEMIKYILKKPEIFLSDTLLPKKTEDFINISTRIYSQTIKLSENHTKINLKNIVSIQMKSIMFDYISDYTVSEDYNTLVFQEKLAEDKDLWSQEILIQVEPGNYTKEQFIEEIANLMNENSISKNIYNLTFNSITSKLSLFSSKAPFIDNKKDLLRAQINAVEKNMVFNIISEKSNILSILGFSENNYKNKNIYNGCDRYKLQKNKNIHIDIRGNKNDMEDLVKLFNTEVPCQIGNLVNFEEENIINFDHEENFEDLIVFFSTSESQDTEFEIVLKVNYCQFSKIS